MREGLILKSATDGMTRRNFMKSGVAAGALTSIEVSSQNLHGTSSPTDGRQIWIEIVTRVSYPVLSALSQRKLKSTMPVETAPGKESDRRQFTYLEALGRLLTGIAPWLETGPTAGEEGKVRQQYALLAREAIEAATDPTSPDYMNFNKGQQPIVDAAFLALAILRAPTELWQKLDTVTQSHLIKALQSTRVILPGFSNWLMFSATIETALALMGQEWDAMRIDYALRSVESWYKGDGTYGDGPSFHWDYYNSFVIQPMLLHVLDGMSKYVATWDHYQPVALARAQRYAAIQERLISPEGTFPPIGRSLCYRFGAFQLLAEVALRKQLPEGIEPEQVRCALTAVMRRMIDAPGTFDGKGWLQIGFYGHQPDIAESYISTGSLYLCSAAWLPLGLPASDRFWSGERKLWTSKKIWSGENVKADHALDEGQIT
jgi:hypothetical protein